jgi:hypothetical protein
MIQILSEIKTEVAPILPGTNQVGSEDDPNTLGVLGGNPNG